VVLTSFFGLFFAILVVECRAMNMLSNFSYHLSNTLSPFVFELVLLTSWAGLELEILLPLPPE
jgi:hypothetical protein